MLKAKGKKLSIWCPARPDAPTEVHVIAQREFFRAMNRLAGDIIHTCGGGNSEVGHVLSAGKCLAFGLDIAI